jgi:hypothetical protein
LVISAFYILLGWFVSRAFLRNVVRPKKWFLVTVWFFLTAILLVLLRLVEFLDYGVINVDPNISSSFEVGYISKILASMTVINLGLSQSLSMFELAISIRAIFYTIPVQSDGPAGFLQKASKTRIGIYTLTIFLSTITIICSLLMITNTVLEFRADESRVTHVKKMNEIHSQNGLVISIFNGVNVFYLFIGAILLNRTLTFYCKGTSLDTDRTRLNRPFIFFTFI